MKIAHRQWYRGVFAAAAVYNILWGLFTAVNPKWFFEFSGMEAPRYLEIFACVGMVVGLYGVLYAAAGDGWADCGGGFGGKGAGADWDGGLHSVRRLAGEGCLVVRGK